MPKFTNKHNIPLPLAVLLASDDYDHNPDPYTISVTSLLKSVRQIVLGSRTPASEQEMDVSDLIASTQGTALHDAMERAWLSPKLPEVLMSLGLPKKVAEGIRVNPTEGSTPLDVFLERRTDKKVGNWTVSGKFDFIMEGKPMDLKNTSTFSWNKDPKDYILQLSLYRWLNPDITNKDLGQIMYWFKDFSSYSKGDYPPFPIVGKEFQLMSPAETQQWVTQKLALVDRYIDQPEPELPLCTQQELWQNDPTFKYYASPSAKRASKNFTTYAEAYNFMLSKGKGEVREVKSEPRACNFCPARLGCSQYGSMVQQGIIS